MSDSSLDPFGHPRVPYRGYYDKKHCDDRRAWAEQFAHCSLEQCGQWWLKEGSKDSCSCTKLKGNVENVIGLAKVPLAICGPLLFNGEHINGYRLCPFATTEGALVASITRGATALTRSGGVYAKVSEKTQIRSPYFRLRSLQEVDYLIKWIDIHFETLKNMVQQYSQHTQLKKISITRHDRVAVAHFQYSTGDACGQNMVTSATSQLCKWILASLEVDLPQVKVVHYCIESGLSGDKSMTYLNLWRTRGCHVQAEAWIPEGVLKSVLKVDVPTIAACYEEWQHLLAGSGKIGFGINVSNLITGVFIATGQDVASIESCHSTLSLSILSAIEIESIRGVYRNNFSDKEPGIYVSITLPSLHVGTVGGGTGLATQKECLHLIDCYGNGGVDGLCELIAGYALGLELSTLSALASGQFASAHEKLGRNHPTLGFTEEHLNEEFFSNILGPSMKSLLEAMPFQIDTGNSILSEITKTELNKKVGHFGYSLKFVDLTGSKDTMQVVIKSKTTATETCNVLNKMAQACGQTLAVQYQKYKMLLGFNYCDIREVEIYNMKNEDLRKFFPKIYHTVLQPSKDIFIIAMEYLTSNDYTHLDTVNCIEEWSIDDVKVVLRDLAQLHSVYLCKTEELESYQWMEKQAVSNKVEMSVLWIELLKHAKYEFPEIWSEQRVKLVENAILNNQKISSVLSSAPLTLIHNDCNPRNICLRKSGACNKEGNAQTCLYDWELATVDVPQRDVAEFLAFSLMPSSSNDTRLQLLNFYRCELERYSGMDYPLDRFMEVYNAAVLDFVVRRLLLYSMAHTFKEYTYLPRVVNSVFAYIEGVDMHITGSSKL